MAKYRTVGGKLLLVGGKATRGNCCCGVCCSDFASERALYLTIDEFDAGGLIFGVAAKASFGSPFETSPNNVTWYTENQCDDGNVIVAYNLLCSGSEEHAAGTYSINMFSGQVGMIFDNCMDFDPLYTVWLDDSDYGFNVQPMGSVVCSPFFLQATVNISVWAWGTTPGFDPPTFTGTMRVTITE